MPTNNSSNNLNITGYIVSSVASQSIYPTIQAAIDAAASVATNTDTKTVYVIGNFTEDIVLKDFVNVIGSSLVDGLPCSTVINGNATYASSNSSSYILVKGVTFFSQNTSPCLSITLQGNIAVSDCAFYNYNGGEGIVLNGTGNPSINVKNSSIYVTTGTCFSSLGAGGGEFFNSTLNAQTGGRVLNCISGSGFFFRSCSTSSQNTPSVVALTSTQVFFMHSIVSDSFDVSGTVQLIILYSIVNVGNNQSIATVHTGAAFASGYCVLNSDAPSGYLVAGNGPADSGAFQYQGNIYGASAQDIDPDINVQILPLHPFATAGTIATASIGTSSFDSTYFNITNGFVSLNSPPFGMQWSVITANQAAEASKGYYCNGASQILLSLPATSNVGDTFSVYSYNSNGWQITQGVGQNIQIGNSVTQTGTGGYIVSSQMGDCVTLVCSVVNTSWTVVSSVGNIGFV